MPENVEKGDNNDAIPDDALILRRVPVGYVLPDGSFTKQAYEPTKRDIDDNLSVNVKSKSSYSETVQDPAKFRVLEIRAGDVRKEEGLEVVADYCPSYDIDNKAHALIKGLKRNNNASKRKQRRLVAASTELTKDD